MSFDDDPKQAEQKRRRTSQYMTRYERARVLGMRATAIAKGAPPTVDFGNETDPLAIALLELEAHKIPVTIRRTLRDGTVEEFSANDLSQDYAGV